MGRVTGKVAVISGAARGQGRSHARMLAAEGADIIAVDLCADIETNEYPLARPEDLDETARLVEKEGQRVVTAIADVRDRGALSAAIDQGVAELGHLDVVVANAGICPLTAGLPPQAFADAVDVDLIGVLNLVHVEPQTSASRRVDHRDRLQRGIHVVNEHQRYRRRSRRCRVCVRETRCAHTMSTTLPWRWPRSLSG